jgi:hypothetical protein
MEASASYEARSAPSSYSTAENERQGNDFNPSKSFDSEGLVASNETARNSIDGGSHAATAGARRATRPEVEAVPEIDSVGWTMTMLLYGSWASSVGVLATTRSRTSTSRETRSSSTKEQRDARDQA